MKNNEKINKKNQKIKNDTQKFKEKYFDFYDDIKINKRDIEW